MPKRRARQLEPTCITGESAKGNSTSSQQQHGQLEPTAQHSDQLEPTAIGADHEPRKKATGKK